MPKPRNNPLDNASATTDAAGQAKHRPDKLARHVEPKGLKRDRMDQINVLVPKGLRKPFKRRAEDQGTTMSELVSKWIEEYMTGKR